MTKKEIDIYQYDKMEELESGSKAKYIVPEIWNKAFAEGVASCESRTLSAVPSEEIENAAKEYYDNEISADCDRPKKLDYDDIIEAFCSGVEWTTQRGIAG